VWRHGATRSSVRAVLLAMDTRMERAVIWEFARLLRIQRQHWPLLKLTLAPWPCARATVTVMRLALVQASVCGAQTDNLRSSRDAALVTVDPANARQQTIAATQRHQRQLQQRLLCTSANAAPLKRNGWGPRTVPPCV